MKNKAEKKALIIPLLLFVLILIFAFSGILVLEYAAAGGLIICLLVFARLGMDQYETGDDEDYTNG